MIYLIGMTSCSSTKGVNYRNYEQIPINPTSQIYRAVLKSIPYTRENAFYGNYGGSGNTGQKPIDQMDELFRRHDIVYHETTTITNMMEADRMLVLELKKIDAATLSPHGLQYRKSAINFMQSPMAFIIGKPLPSVFLKKEPIGSFFPDKNSVTTFFNLSHEGFPEKRSNQSGQIGLAPPLDGPAGK